MKSALALALLAVQVQQPVFRAEIDFVLLDVSVLAHDRKPVTGLSAADFTVFEDGVPQKIETFEAVVLPAPQPTTATWSNTVPGDVENNLDQDAGSLLTLVIDDEGIGMAGGQRVKGIARAIVDRMSGSDRMAVLFTLASGRSQDFTTDRALVYAAIDRFTPALYIPEGVGPPEGGRTRPPSDRSPSRRSACPGVVGVLSSVARVTAEDTGRRKAVLVISERLAGLADPQCFDPLLQLYGEARRANINIYPINPRGLTGIGEAEIAAWEDVGKSMNDARQQAGAERTLADNTGGISLSQTNAFTENIERVFVENRSYYLVGYRSTNKSKGQALRRISVQVARDGVTVRARSGYAPHGTARPAAEREVPEALAAASASLVSLNALPLEATVIPFRRSGGRSLVVVAVARPRIQSGSAMVTEEIQIRAVLIDAYGQVKGTAERRIQARGVAAAGAAADLRVPMSIDAKPGRYQVRVAANSRASGATGSVFVNVDVPDFDREPISLSGVSLRVSGDSPAIALAGLDALVPFTPSTRRAFRLSHRVEAAVRLYARDLQTPVTLVCRVRDARDAEVWSAAAGMEAGAVPTRDGRLAQCPIPIGQFAAGSYLFEFEAISGAHSVIRSVKFSME